MELHARCICVCVELKCHSNGASGSNQGGNSGSCVCVYTSQFMYNKLYIYFYDLYSPVSSIFLCVYVTGPTALVFNVLQNCTFGVYM